MLKSLILATALLGAPAVATSIEARALPQDRVGELLGGSNKNATGELDVHGWPKKCSNACADFSTFIDKEGSCSNAAGTVQSCDKGGRLWLEVKQVCQSLDSYAPCQLCVYSDRVEEVKTELTSNVNTCKSMNLPFPASIEGVNKAVAPVSAAAAASASGSAAARASGSPAAVSASGSAVASGSRAAGASTSGSAAASASAAAVTPASGAAVLSASAAGVLGAVLLATLF